MSELHRTSEDFDAAVDDLRARWRAASDWWFDSTQVQFEAQFWMEISAAMAETSASFRNVADAAEHARQLID